MLGDVEHAHVLGDAVNLISNMRSTVQSVLAGCGPSMARSSWGAPAHLRRASAAGLYRTLEVMQRNFWKTIEADGNDRCSDTDRGIAHHIAMFPWSRAHMPW